MISVDLKSWKLGKVRAENYRGTGERKSPFLESVKFEVFLSFLKFWDR
jgi:hypothetical protein